MNGTIFYFSIFQTIRDIDWTIMKPYVNKNVPAVHTPNKYSISYGKRYGKYKKQHLKWLTIHLYNEMWRKQKNSKREIEKGKQKKGTRENPVLEKKNEEVNSNKWGMSKNRNPDEMMWQLEHIIWTDNFSHFVEQYFQFNFEMSFIWQNWSAIYLFRGNRMIPLENEEIDVLILLFERRKKIYSGIAHKWHWLKWYRQYVIRYVCNDLRLLSNGTILY